MIFLETKATKIGFEKEPMQFCRRGDSLTTINFETSIELSVQSMRSPKEQPERIKIKSFADTIERDFPEKDLGDESVPVVDLLYSNFSHFVTKICSKSDLLELFENIFDADERVLTSQEMSCLKTKSELLQENERVFAATVVLTSKGKVLLIPSDFNPYYFLDETGSTKMNKSMKSFSELDDTKLKIFANSTVRPNELFKTTSFEVKARDASGADDSHFLGDQIPDAKCLKVYMIDLGISEPVGLFCMRDVFVSDRQTLYKIALDDFSQFYLKNICYLSNHFYLLHCHPLSFEKILAKMEIDRAQARRKNSGKSYMSFSDQTVKKIVNDDQWMCLQLRTFSTRFSKSLLLHEPVVRLHPIRLLRPHESFMNSHCFYFLNSLKLVECANMSFKLVYLDKLLILLDHLSYGQALLDIFFDSQLNLLFLVLAGGQSKCFRFEIQNIYEILFSSVDYLSSFASKEDTHLALLNSIQVNVHFLHSTEFSALDCFPLADARMDFFQGFNQFNNFRFLKRNGLVSSSDFNDYLVFHAMFFYNNYSSSFVDFDRLQKNSKYLAQDFFQIFRSSLI